MVDPCFELIGWFQKRFRPSDPVTMINKVIATMVMGRSMTAHIVFDLHSLIWDFLCKCRATIIHYTTSQLAGVVVGDGPIR